MTIANVSWSFDGTTLDNYAYAVRALGFEESLPPRRGENVIVPGVHGATYVSKVYDERALPLLMFIDSQGTAGGTRSANQLQQNLHTIKQLFGTDGTHTLTRTMGTVSMSATVECRGLRISPDGAYSYSVMADLVFCDPFWYATGTTTATTPFSSVPTNLSVSNAGTYKADNVTITYVCPSSPAALLTNPKVTIDSVWVRYTGVVPTGGTLTINTSTYTATLGTTDVTGYITHAGAVRWLSVPRGSATATVSADGISNTPTVTLAFQAPYL